ncbi:MAG: nucleotide kinase domain-containing protein [Thermoleophilaceae bacterium]
MSATFRDDVYGAYWELAAERQRIFYRRLADNPSPWTEDRVLREYRFCNAFRASDRVSQYLIRHVIYADDDIRPEDLLLRIVLFRLFSRPRTWELLKAEVALRADSFDPVRLGDLLDAELAAGEAIYTNAFILAATATFGHRRKHRNHLALVELMLRDRLGRSIASVESLSGLYELLLGYPMIGPFMAYQLAIDINYSELVDFDESSFTMPGPGALRGIRKVFADPGVATPSELILWVTENQERLGIDMPTLWGRRLQAIDCQNLFCELDKYARVKFPHLRSERVRIKQRFAPAGRPPAPFYPPKWSINERIGAAARARPPGQ